MYCRTLPRASSLFERKLSQARPFLYSPRWRFQPLLPDSFLCHPEAASCWKHPQSLKSYLFFSFLIILGYSWDIRSYLNNCVLLFKALVSWTYDQFWFCEMPPARERVWWLLTVIFWVYFTISCCESVTGFFLFKRIG